MQAAASPASHADAASPSSSLLWHVSLSPEHPETVILLHGLNGSHYSWIDTGVAAPLAQRYHLLIPDLPLHSNSSHCGPASLDNTKNRLAELVRSAAHNGKAHVVGFSYGGYAALVFAQAHPELVHSLLLSGVYDMVTGRGWQLYLAGPANFLVSHLVPTSIIRRVERNMGLKLSENDRRESEKNCKNPNVGKAGWKDIKGLVLPPRGDTTKWQLASRTLLIAAAKPMHDPVEATIELGKALAQDNPESKTAILPDRPHPWMYPEPELFAETVAAWVSKGKLPDALQIQAS